MDYNYIDLAEITQRRADFIRKYGPHDIVSDIDTLVSEVSRLRRETYEHVCIKGDLYSLVNAMKHLATKKHKMDLSCRECYEADQVRIAIKNGEIQLP